MDIKLEDYNSSEESITINIEKSHASLLPLEVIIYLMSYLPYPDRVSASQVCRLWYEASLHPKFINQEKVVIKRSPEAFPLFKNSPRPYFHLMLIEIEINNKIKAFWQRVAPSLKSLTFCNCDMNDKMFIEVLSKCINLEILVLDNCRELFMAGRLLENPDDVISLSKSLSHLKELSLISNRYLSDALLNRLISAMPNLENVSLDGCQISYHAGLFKKYYPEALTMDSADYASETVLTFCNFYNTINKKMNIIKGINLSRTLVDSSALSLVSESNKLQLEELHVVSCEQLTNAGILSLTHHQKSLVLLDLSYCSRITDQAMLLICKNLNKLKKLAVRNCRAITDLGIVHLQHLSDLEELDISQCEQVTGVGIQQGLCSRVNKRLRKLSMEGLNTITSSTVVLISENMPDLTHLNLSYCFNAVTDTSVQAIFQNQVRLRSLRLANCDAVTDAGLTGMGMGATVDNSEAIAVVEALDHLALSQPRLHISLCSKAEDEIIRDAYRKKAVQKMCEAQLIQSANVGYSLVRLKGLQELDLRCCNKITDVSLKYSFHFLELQHLNLSQCQQITHIGLSSIGENNPSIDTLNLSHCYNITDEGIVAITKGLPRLKYLDIKGCNQLTDASVVAIVEHCHQLRYLDASHCSKMSDKITDLLHRLPLQTFYSKMDPNERTMPPWAPPLPRF